MKIHEDRSHMNIDTRWFEKGYAKEDVHSLRLQSLCTEAEAAANKQFYDSHTCEEWEQYIRQASLESSAAMKPIIPLKRLSRTLFFELSELSNILWTFRF